MGAMTRRLQDAFEELAQLSPAEQDHYADLIRALKWVELKQSVEQGGVQLGAGEVIAWDAETAKERLRRNLEAEA